MTSLSNRGLAVLLLSLSCCSVAFAQKGFVPVIPDEPVDFSQVNDSLAWVRGHWTEVDPTKKELTGPSTSEISCDKDRRTCTDTNANIMATGNSFGLSAACDEYSVERWNSKEIVASNIGGTCRIRNVIKFDRVQKRVYFMQMLSEPIEDLPKGLRDFCKLTGMNVELKNSTLWRR